MLPFFLQDNVNFAKIPEKDINLMDKAEYIEKAWAKYDSYGSEWQRDYFNNDNGGYLVIDKQRIKQGDLSKQEKAKYDKEYDMCLTLAQNGHKIEYLKLTEGSFDIYMDDISADLKKTKTHNNMVEYAKKAIREQGAEVVVFEFKEETVKIYAGLEILKRIGIHGKYYFTGKKAAIHEF